MILSVTPQCNIDMLITAVPWEHLNALLHLTIWEVFPRVLVGNTKKIWRPFGPSHTLSLFCSLPPYHLRLLLSPPLSHSTTPCRLGLWLADSFFSKFCITALVGNDGLRGCVQVYSEQQHGKKKKIPPHICCQRGNSPEMPGIARCEDVNWNNPWESRSTYVRTAGCPFWLPPFPLPLV